MAGIAAARLHAHHAGLQVEFVVDDDHLGGRELVKAHGFAGRAPALVHVGRRLEQDALPGADLALRGQALETLLPRPEGVAARDLVNRHKANVMAVAGVFITWIAQSDDQLHDCNPSLPSPMPDQMQKT